MGHTKAQAKALDLTLVIEKVDMFTYEVKNGEGVVVGRHRTARWAWDSAYYGVKARLVSRGRKYDEGSSFERFTDDR